MTKSFRYIYADTQVDKFNHEKINFIFNYLHDFSWCFNWQARTLGDRSIPLTHHHRKRRPNDEITLTLINTQLGNCALNFSNSGEISLHGPHHFAKKSTNTTLPGVARTFLYSSKEATCWTIFAEFLGGGCWYGQMWIQSTVTNWEWSIVSLFLLHLSLANIYLVSLYLCKGMWD